MRATTFLLLACALALLACVSVSARDSSAQHEMHSAMPLEPESVTRAIEQHAHMDGVAHDEDATFFLELSQYVDDAALLEAAAEHEVEAEAVVDTDAEAETEAEAELDAEVDGELDLEAEAGEEQVAVTKCGKKIIWERNSEPNPEAALVETEAETEMEAESEAEVEADAETEVDAEAETEVETEAEAETEVDAEAEVETEAETEVEAEAETDVDAEAEEEFDSALVESDSVTEVFTESAADQEVADAAEADQRALHTLESLTATESDPDADHNPHALFAPKLRSAPAQLAVHHTAVSQMKRLMMQAERDYPRNVAALHEENPYLTHVF